MRVLLVEDDPKLSAMVARGLEEEDHQTTRVRTAEDGLAELQRSAFDVCILDVMLPGIDGFTGLERLRRFDPRTPVLMLTARDGVQDRVKGLKLGADDYLAKPFAFTELLARLDALHRRTARQARLLRVGNLVIDEGRHQCALSNGDAVELSARQFSLLALLARDGGRVVTRSMVLSDVLGYSFMPSANIVDVHVSNLRQKLQRVDSKVTIVTVRGVGYRLEEAP